MSDAPHRRDLPGEIAEALANRPQQRALTHAVGGVNRLRRRRIAEFPGYEAARQRAREIKERAIEELPRHLARLEDTVVARGGHVHLAADAGEACRIIVEIARRAGVERAVKSKSMTSEEVGLNQALEAAGIHVRETDLGEYIVQLAGERPSHIVAPIIHKTVDDVRDAFRRGLGLDEVPERPEELTQLARRALRREFLAADMGITGANFLLANTGIVVLVENEGNARLSTQLPRLHVTLAGVEKVLPRARDLLPFLQLLPRSATGQLQTSYLSFISGPGWAPGIGIGGGTATPLTGAGADDEGTTGPGGAPAHGTGGAPAGGPGGAPVGGIGSAASGAREFHLVLLDNGRMAMRDDPLLREALYCIRCGACMTVCPPYQVVGGHVYGGPTYQSGIGNAWEAGVRGLGVAAGFNDLCTTCSRCYDVCPVRIDIPWMNAVLRDRIAAVGPEPGALEKIVVAGLLPAEERRSVPPGRRLFANPGRVYGLARATAPLSRWLLAAPPVRWLLERFAGIDARRPLPLPRGERLSSWQRRRGGIVVSAPEDARRLVEAGEMLGSAGGGWGVAPEERPAFGGERGSSRPAIVLVADCHTEHVDVEAGTAAVEVLEGLGTLVIVVADRCCGRAALSQGLVATARRQAEEMQDVLRPLARAGHPIVGIEPSCLSCIVEDHPKLLADSFDPGRVAACCKDVLAHVELELGADARGEDDLAAGRSESRQRDGPAATPASGVPAARGTGAGTTSASTPRRAVLHGHCQQKTSGWLEPALRALRRLGVEVRTTTAECCGMAGSFGYKRDYADLSRELGRRLAAEVGELRSGRHPDPPVPGASPAMGDGFEVLAAGTSCRAQLRDLAGCAVRHPVELVAELLRVDRIGRDRPR